MYPVGLGAKRVTGLIEQQDRACRKGSLLLWQATPWAHRSQAGQFSKSETESDSPYVLVAETDTVLRSSNTPSSNVNSTVAVN